MTELDARRNTNLSRSRSAQSLKNSVHDPQGTEDRLTILLQLFWIAVSLLESDYEYEFLLAVKFLEKVTHSSIMSAIVLQCVLYMQGC